MHLKPLSGKVRAETEGNQEGYKKMRLFNTRGQFKGTQDSRKKRSL